VLPFFIPANSTSHGLLQRWAESLPRVIWELDAKDETATSVILHFLLWLQQRDTKLFEPATLDNVASRLHPFFHLDHPSRGAMPGPWTRLESEELRMLALDVAYTWMERGENKLREAVDKAVCHPGLDAERAHWEGLNRVV
jgi:pre-rRNA-processing protein IPI1